MAATPRIMAEPSFCHLFINTGFPAWARIANSRLLLAILASDEIRIGRACSPRLSFRTALWPLQLYILERRRPRKRIDLHQRRVRDPRPNPARPEIVPDRREAHALVQDLLDIGQHRAALLGIGFAQLLLVQLIEIRPAAIGIDAVARYNRREAGRGIAHD